MAKGPRYNVPYRRRREAKTNYKARRILATSGKPRFVVRTSNRNIRMQFVESKVEGDDVLVHADSWELNKYGWLGGSKNTPSAYLLGFVAGHKALKLGIEEAYLDIGLSRPTKGARVFAAVKGARDAGLEIPCDSEVMPEPDKIEGIAISEYAVRLKDPHDLKAMFSGYLRRGLKPKELPEHFGKVKTRIEEDLTS